MAKSKSKPPRRSTPKATTKGNDAVLERIAAERPDVTLVDWNRYSRSHPGWFDADGLHLDAAGATAMATLVHKTLAGLGLT